MKKCFKRRFLVQPKAQRAKAGVGAVISNSIDKELIAKSSELITNSDRGTRLRQLCCWTEATDNSNVTRKARATKGMMARRSDSEATTLAVAFGTAL